MLLLDKVRRRAEVQVVPERRVNPSRNRSPGGRAVGSAAASGKAPCPWRT